MKKLQFLKRISIKFHRNILTFNIILKLLNILITELEKGERFCSDTTEKNSLKKKLILFQVFQKKMNNASTISNEEISLEFYMHVFHFYTKIDFSALTLVQIIRLQNDFLR